MDLDVRQYVVYLICVDMYTILLYLYRISLFIFMIFLFYSLVFFIFLAFWPFLHLTSPSSPFLILYSFILSLKPCSQISLCLHYKFLYFLKIIYKINIFTLFSLAHYSLIIIFLGLALKRSVLTLIIHNFTFILISSLSISLFRRACIQSFSFEYIYPFAQYSFGSSSYTSIKFSCSLFILSHFPFSLSSNCSPLFFLLHSFILSHLQ